MKKINFILVSALLTLILSCSKADKDNGNNGGENSSYSNYDFYSTGKGENNQGSFDLTWKNFQPLYTSKTIDQTNWGHLWPNIIVSGSDLYQAATKKFRNTGVGVEEDFGGCVLKNGTILYSDAGQATRIAGLCVNGSDVYYLSTHYQNADLAVSRPKLWKNGATLYSLTTPYASGQQNAFDVSVIGSDIYVGGYDSNLRSNESSCGYWKNSIYNELFKITDGSYVYSLRRKKFYVAQNQDKYYMASFITNDRTFESKLYKNSEKVAFTTGVFLDFTIVGNDIYIFGFDEFNQCSIWKNGIKSILPLNNSTGNAVCLSSTQDGKIFLGGSLDLKVCIWEYNISNNTLTKVNQSENRTSLVSMIAVKK